MLILYSQEKLDFSHEIYLRTTNEYDVNLDSLIFEMHSVSTVYTIDLYSNIFFQTDSFQHCIQRVPIPFQYDSYGFEHVISPLEKNNFAYGLYKVSVSDLGNNNLFNFYLDYRDCDYSFKYNGKNDIWIDFEAYRLNCKIAWYNENSWKEIENNNVYRIWEEKYKSVRAGLQNTDDFPFFWENCLVAIPYERSDANMFYIPHLVWGPKPNYSA